MKKSILFCAAVMMAASINATEKTVTIDLAQFQAIDANATAKLTDNELTVSYDLGEWAASGIECAINQQNVTNISFEFKGDATVDKWVSFFPYLSKRCSRSTFLLHRRRPEYLHLDVCMDRKEIYAQCSIVGVCRPNSPNTLYGNRLLG